MKDQKRILVASDIHWCHIEWYGVTTEERMERFLRHLEEEYQKDPFEAVLLLGDFSLDFWEWGIKGCYINDGFSYVKVFADYFVPRIQKLGVQLAMIPGNHEQYGEERWRELTGFSRQSHVVCGDYLFLLLDTFGADLDPTEHSDGTYSGADVAYIKRMMAAFPEHKVILCAHHFDHETESEEFRTLVREEKRILCLMGGHVHKSRVIPLGEEWGGKALLYTGNYSYNAGNEDTMWGFRDLLLSDHLLLSRYITPENTITLDGETIHQPYGYQDEYEMEI